jgi:TonB family protein
MRVSKFIVILLFTFFFRIASAQPHKASDTTIYITTDVPAEFQGGAQALYEYIRESVLSKLKIPPEAPPLKKFMARFVIEPTGAISNLRIIKSSENKDLDQLMLSALKNMPNWKPAELPKGTKVRQEYTLPLYLCGR